MALKRRGTQKESTTVEYDRLGAGEFEARLAYVADLGLQVNEYDGVRKDDTQQIALGLEVIDKPVTIDGKEVPRLIWTFPIKVYNTLTEKGNELKAFKVFGTGTVGEEADWESVLGEPCNVKIKVGKSRDGTQSYDNIDSLEPIPTKYKSGVGEGQITPCVGDADNPNNEATAALYGYCKTVLDNRIQEEAANEYE